MTGVDLSVNEGVALLALNRPEVLNALSGDLIADLTSALTTLKADAGVRVLLLTGRGRAFCAGADLRDPMMGVGSPAAERGRRFAASADSGINALARALHDFGKPKIAAVNGPAVGGGAALALLADIAIAGRSAYFQQPFTSQLGLVPDLGASYQLMHRIGPTRALALTMLGERVTAAQAVEWGLVWQCVDDDALMDTALAAARRLAEGAPRALAALPDVMWRAFNHDFDAHLDMERDVQSRLVQTEDFMEAVSAFRAKRKPLFRGL